MAVKRLALSIGILAALLAAPLAFPQDGGAGHPDDIAALLPEDTFVFAEIVRPGRIYKDRLEYLGAFCTKDGKTRVLEQLEKAVKEQGGDELPEKLQKDFEKGFPAVQRMAVAMSHPRGDQEPFWAIVATASTDEFFKAMVEDLQVFAGDPILHEGSKILVIRKLGKHDLHANVCFAAMGKRLVVSSTVESVKAVLDRAAGKGKGGDLRKNVNYARFAAPTSEDPAFRAFAEMNWGSMSNLMGGWGYRRAGAHGTDVADATLGFRKIRGATIEATLKPGKIAATTRILVDSPCPLYDVVRQPAGTKDALKLIPADAQVAVHLNLKGGTPLLAEIDALIKRYAEIEKKSMPKGNPAFDRPDFDWKKEFEREIGLPIDDVAAAIGTEAAFAMVGQDALTGEQNMVGSLLFVIALADVEKAKAVIEKVTAKIGPYETRKEGDATFWSSTQDGGPPLPVFAIQGKMGLIGTKLDTLKKALKAGSDGTGFAKQLPAGIAEASKIMAVRNNALWSLAKLGAGAALPDIEKDLDLNALSTLLVVEGKNELRLSSLDAGLGLGVQAGVMMVPLAFVVAGSIRPTGLFLEDEDPAAKKGETPKESPPLPADKLAAEVKKHLAAMRADDVVAREDAEKELKALGLQAAPLLAGAVRKETDAEVKGRILGILSFWKAYDAFPELLKTKVDGFLAGFQKATGEENGGRFIQWRQEGMADFPYGMEPGWVDSSLIQRVEHHDLLDASQGVRALAERLTSDKFNVQQQRNLAAVFAYTDCGAAGDLLVAAKQKVEDPEAKCFLQMALGWSSDAKAREALLAGLKDADVWMRRSSFLGIEKSKDTAAIGKLMELLTDKDHGTQWNASFTLRELTRGRVSVNIYVPDEELKASIAAGRDWWEKNKATYKFGQ
jgi:hypothetical protein